MIFFFTIKLKQMKGFGLLVLLFGLFGCASIPKKAKAVNHFKIDKYLGKWYEIARFDFRFERNLNNTTAEYSLNKDGSVKVLNKGFNYLKNESTSAEGKARFVGNQGVAQLKVILFGRFYTGYDVIALERDYEYALVARKNLSSLSIVSRTATI